jgi:hypothetical protein
MARWRLKALDIPLAVVLSAAAAIPWMLPGEPGAAAVVTYPGGEVRVDLDETRTLVLQGPVGRTVVRIEGGRAWVESSDCPLTLCVKMGKIDRAGEAVWCVPNGVGVRIEGGSGVDAVTR